jgi:hypothetical protein
MSHSNAKRLASYKCFHIHFYGPFPLPHIYVITATKTFPMIEAVFLFFCLHLKVMYYSLLLSSLFGTAIYFESFSCYFALVLKNHWLQFIHIS